MSINTGLGFNPMINLTNQFNNLNLNNQISPISINDFLKLEDLGEGKHGYVKKVKYIHNNMNYALKMIPQSLFKTNNGQNNLENETDYLREVAVLKDLSTRNNNHVIKLYANFQDIYFRYIVTDFVEGQTLDKLREEHQNKNEYIQQKVIINIFRQLLETLVFLHDQCFIMHRDIKPENIIIDKYGNIKLLDFGLSAYLINMNPSLISRKSFKGSRIYVPPEILYSKFRNYDYKIDIFCLGFTMYNLMNPNDINGKTNLPQDTDNNNQRIDRINTNEFYDDWLMDFIKKLYSFDPNERPTAQQALYYLLNNLNNPRRFQPNIAINKNNANIIRSASTQINVIRDGMNINTGLNMNMNKNFIKKPTDVMNWNPGDFLQPNQLQENKLITSMKCLLHILYNLDCMDLICYTMHSLFTNKGKNTFMELYFNMHEEYKKMKNNLLPKDKYEKSINNFIIELFKRNLSSISGPRPMILFFMISSIIRAEFGKFCPEYKNEILEDILSEKNYPFDNIIPIKYYNQKCLDLMKSINNFKKFNRSPFVDNFYLLGLSIEKCPQCGHIFNAESINCQFLQLKIEKNEDTIENILNNFFKESFTTSVYQCIDCDSTEKMSKQFFCLNSPEYLLLELEDKNKILFDTEIFIPLYNGEKYCYTFIGAIYKRKYDNHSEYFAVSKKENNISLYDNDTIKNNCDINLINSEMPSMVFYQKLK